MDVETVVIGAGVVGLAVAAELASGLTSAGNSVMVLERHARFGQETSSHNSEVLHAGLYYAPGSHKARLCVEGNLALRELDARVGGLVKLTGKVVVGQDSEQPALEALFQRARENGAEGLKLLSREELRTLEPALSSTIGMLSEHTGIIDSHALMRYFLQRLDEHGADVVYRTQVQAIEARSDGYLLHTLDDAGQAFALHAGRVVNSAGLAADRLAAMVGIDLDAAGYRLRFCRGDYFSTRPRCWGLVSRLIYPIPGQHAGGLGIHVTLDFAGRMRLGPDTTWLEPGEALSYQVNPASRDRFAAAVQRYLPDIQAEDLEPELAGIRPKLQMPGGPARDFVIEEESTRGLPGFVNLIGIESPGLTACIAIARRVVRLLEGRG